MGKNSSFSGNKPIFFYAVLKMKITESCVGVRLKKN